MAFNNLFNNRSKNSISSPNNNLPNSGSKINLTNIGNPAGPVSNINHQELANSSNINLSNPTPNLTSTNQTIQPLASVEAEADNQLNQHSNMLNIVNQKKYL